MSDDGPCWYELSDDEGVLAEVILAVPPYWIALPVLAVLIGTVYLVKRAKISFLTVLFVLFVGLMFGS